MDDPILYSSFSQVSSAEQGQAMKRAKKLAATPNSSVRIVQDVRTISLPWGYMNQPNDEINIILDKVLRSFRKQ